MSSWFALSSLTIQMASSMQGGAATSQKGRAGQAR
jgi:hypothetical protein